LNRQVLRSTNAAGRHWLTMTTNPPMQIGPVAPNHCRIGYHLLRAAYAALESLEDGEEVPEEIDIRIDEDGPTARVALPMLPGPANWGSPDEPDEEPVEFLTVAPPGGVADDIDDWIVPLAAALGLDPEPAIAEGGYEMAMAAAQQRVAAELLAVRKEFLASGTGPDRLRFGFKIGLATDDGGTEWLWIEPTQWDVLGRIIATLESEPFNVKGRKSGDVLDVAESEVGDYVIYDPRTGEQKGGYTDRIAADYGLHLPS
jgi:uncharacterized protein YegJ (DUF2314 family)